MLRPGTVKTKVLKAFLFPLSAQSYTNWCVFLYLTLL